MKVCGVIGGGISGLATCYYLSTLGKGIIDRVVLLESSASCGGWIGTRVDESGLLFEKGARSVRSQGDVGSNTIQLIEELGLSKDILPISKSHPSTKNRFIYSKEQLHRLPNSFKSILTANPPFSKPFLLFAFKELIRPKLSSASSSSTPSCDDDDYSVDEFFRRRFGSEVADYAANPLCRGICAGDSAQLSVRSCFRPLFDLEAKFGSVIMGMLLSGKKKKEGASELVGKFREEGWVVWSLKGGLQQLPDALLKHLERSDEVSVDVRTSAGCGGLEFEEGGVQVHAKTADLPALSCEHVFCALPACELAPLLSHKHPTLSEHLGKIHYVDMAVVNMVYPSHVQPPHLGFGHLVPSHVDQGLLGVIYESCTFPLHNGPDHKSRFSVMLGGAWFEKCIGSIRGDRRQLTRRVEELSLRAMSNHLGITVEPEKVVVNILEKCIPQYMVGHHRLVSQISSYIDTAKLPVTLVGASYSGFSVNDCIHNARLAVEGYLAREKGVV